MKMPGNIKTWSLATLPLAILGYVLFSTASDREPRYEMAQATPDQGIEIRQKIFGYSEAGKEIMGYEIGNGDDGLFLFAAIHGNEMGTADLMNELIEEIKADPNLVSPKKRLVIIPIANPDGYYDRVDKLNANEVNLNLNFKTIEWQQYGAEGTFAGEDPFSEKESQVIKRIVEQYRPNMMIAFHSQGALVSPEEGESSVRLGKWYADKTGYEYFDEWDFHGTATRWFWEITGKPAITVELTDHMESDWEINKEALLELISSNITQFVTEEMPNFD
ncbi:MAG: M14 family zinc carboxypeptidase [Candidatus Yanofskybacteria bacterium]|nr:M14 family zinc carboxypeptidase [Candidatus Yanofskybacteria bacterium]